MSHRPEMIESGRARGDLVEGSLFEVINTQMDYLKRTGYDEKEFDINIRDENISLSQYYSHFADGMCEFVPGCVTYKSSEQPVESLTSNHISENCHPATEQEVGKYVHNPRIWKCTYQCGKIFTQEKYMRNHILVMHENPNLIQCKICSQYVSTKGRLKNHMLRHAGVDHLVCLICISKRVNDRSCMRHHLSAKHGINSKHSLFHESYYEMSLKEISLMEKSKRMGSVKDMHKEWDKRPTICKKSANDMEELRLKILEKSQRVKKKLLCLMEKSENIKEKTNDSDETKNKTVTLTYVTDLYKITYKRPNKILTAENGMKLMKLPNGQFKKITSN